MLYPLLLWMRLYLQNIQRRNKNNAAGFTGGFAFADNVRDNDTDKVSVAVFTQALKILLLCVQRMVVRVSRLQFERITGLQRTFNLEAMDVDIASESTRLAKYNILVRPPHLCCPKQTRHQMLH